MAFKEGQPLSLDYAKNNENIYKDKYDFMFLTLETILNKSSKKDDYENKFNTKFF